LKDETATLKLDMCYVTRAKQRLAENISFTASGMCATWQQSVWQNAQHPYQRGLPLRFAPLRCNRLSVALSGNQTKKND
jgi:hypothetical protein